jgi:hypothetical protein
MRGLDGVVLKMLSAGERGGREGKGRFVLNLENWSMQFRMRRLDAVVLKMLNGGECPAEKGKAGAF